MINENLGCLLEGLFRMNGTVGGYFKHQLLIVGLLCHTIILDCELDVADRSVDGVNSDVVDFFTELTILVSRNVATSLVDAQL